MIVYKNIGLKESEERKIEKLLEIKNFEKTPLEDMWYLMDYVWDKCECDNTKLNYDNINKFYAHPVWLLNGLFIEQHKESMMHRTKISKFIQGSKLKKIIDYGGGFATLARLMAEINPEIQVDIYEPFINKFSLRRIEEYKNIKVIDELEKKYECLVSTDVLEHLENPLETLKKMINSVEIGGNLILANCFEPCIKCHLPKNFHYRYSFKFFARKMGIKKISNLDHIEIYLKVEEKTIDLEKFQKYISVSELNYKFLENLKRVKRYIKSKI